jgi:YaiO family outer membrane protein
MTITSKNHLKQPIYWLFFLVFTFSNRASAQTVKPATPVKPTPVEKLYKQARSSAANHNLDTAIVLMQKACKLVPKDMDLRLYLARLYAWHKDFKEAEDELELVLEKTPQSRDAQGVLSDILLWSKQWTRLDTHTKEVLLQLDMKAGNREVSVPFIQKWANGLIEQNRYKEAEKALFPVRDRLTPLWELAKTKLMVNTLSLQYAYYDFQKTKDWTVLELDYLRKFHKIDFIGSLNHAARFGRTGSQVMLQAYPKIGNRAYLWLLGAMSDGKTYPDLVYGGSFFLNLNSHFEAEAGIRFFKVKNTEKATILRGGLAYLNNKNRFNYTISQVRGTGVTGLIHLFSYQNHFNGDESFARIGVGSGTNFDVLLSPQYDNFIINSLSINGGANYKITRHIALSAGCSWEKSGSSADNTLQSRWIFDARLAYKF